MWEKPSCHHHYFTRPICFFMLSVRLDYHFANKQGVSSLLASLLTKSRESSPHEDPEQSKSLQLNAKSLSRARSKGWLNNVLLNANLSPSQKSILHDKPPTKSRAKSTHTFAWQVPHERPEQNLALYSYMPSFIILVL